MARVGYVLLASIALILASVAPPAVAEHSIGSTASGSVRPTGRQVSTKSGEGKALVTIRTPSGVPANVRLVGKLASRTVAKAESGASTSATLSMPAAVYRVKAESVVFQGRLYSGKVRPSKIRVRKNRTAKVRVVYKALPVAGQLQTSGITANAINLTWNAPRRAKVQLRRATGNVPPSSVKTGVRVPTNANTATDAGLSAGTQYSYSLFTKRGKRWNPPVTLAAGTVADQGTGAAAYVAASTTLFLAPGGEVARQGGVRAAANSIEAYPTGSGVDLVLPTGVATPVIGSAVVMPISTSLPGGYLGKVSAISVDGRRVTLEPASMTDAFDYWSLDVPEVSGVEQELVPLDAQGAVTAKGRTVRTSGLKLGCGGSGSTTVEFSPSIKLGGSFKGEIKKVGFIPKSAALSTSFWASVTGAAKITSTGELNCGVKFTPVFLQLAATPVPISFYFNPTIAINSSGSVEVSNLGLTATAGGQFSGSLSPTQASFSGGPIFRAQPLTPAISANGGIGLKVGGEVIIGPGAGSSGAGAIIGIGGHLNPIEASYQPQFPWGDSRFHRCMQTSAKATVGLSITGKAWLGSWEVSKSITVSGLNGEMQYGGSPWYLPSGCNQLPNDPLPQPTAPQPTTPPPTTPATPPPTTPPPATRVSISQGAQRADGWYIRFNVSSGRPNALIGCQFSTSDAKYSGQWQRNIQLDGSGNGSSAPQEGTGTTWIWGFNGTISGNCDGASFSQTFNQSPPTPPPAPTPAVYIERGAARTGGWYIRFNVSNGRANAKIGCQFSTSDGKYSGQWQRNIQLDGSGNGSSAPQEGTGTTWIWGFSGTISGNCDGIAFSQSF